MAEMTVFQGCFEETASAVTADPTVDLGSRRLFKGEEFVYCYNAGGADIAIQRGVRLVTGCSGYSVAVTSLSDTLQPCVGVTKHAAAPAANYFWAMTKGFSLVHTANSVITGDFKVLGLAVSGAFGELREPAEIATNVAAGFGLNVNTVSAGSLYMFVNTSF